MPVNIVTNKEDCTPMKTENRGGKRKMDSDNIDWMGITAKRKSTVMQQSNTHLYAI